MAKRSRKKNNNLGRIILFIALIICFGISIFSNSRVILAMNSSKKLQNKIQTISSNNDILSQENTKLQQAIEGKKSEYEAAMANMKVAYLTFDDGPSDNTMQLLNVLDKYKVKATFFVTYKEGYDEEYKEIVKRGHVLANHTYSHDYSKIYSSPDVFIKEVTDLDAKLKEITGVEPSKILRFPGGSNNDLSSTYSGSNFMKSLASRLNDMGYTFFDWNVDSTDASTGTQAKSVIVHRVLSDSPYVKHANILMHDTNMKYTTLEAMPEIIEGLSSKGYMFDVLSHDSHPVQFIQTN